ncbi:hypothetical protein [Paenibacillus sp. FSL P4-0288]|uniref:hypothetical protein n=1 Tax=Paenibacillus sp. FSL P4-0288 TaxID=2921633 RepID=UPI0030F56A90
MTINNGGMEEQSTVEHEINREEDNSLTRFTFNRHADCLCGVPMRVFDVIQMIIFDRSRFYEEK